MRCEDYPCCGHTDNNPCPGQTITDEPWYCDECGFNHAGFMVSCPADDWDDDEDTCDPHTGYCVYDDGECQICANYWLDFQAECMMEDQWLDGSYEE